MMSDAALVLRARGGDEEAFRRLLRRYDGLIRTVVGEYFLPRAEPEDIYQWALVGLHEAVRNYQAKRGASSFKNFAMLCVRRKVKTALTGANRKKQQPLNEADSMHRPVALMADAEDFTLGDTLAFADPKADPVDSLVAREKIAVVSRAVARLTWLERQAVIRVADGLSLAEIAEEEGCNWKSIDNARQRGQKKISRALETAA